MIILKKYNNENIIKKLYKKHFNKKLMINDNIIYNLYDNNNIVGYVIYKIKNSDIYLDWIYAPNYGKIFMERLERKFKKERYCNIMLNLSIDPTENIDTFMKRIKFRKKYGPLLYMKKEL